MPLYVYGYPECEIELEELYPAWRADDPVACPICRGLLYTTSSARSVRARAARRRPSTHRLSRWQARSPRPRLQLLSPMPEVVP